ncbi:cysteine hydrolase family protein [Pseudomonas thivervalensis]|uniref:Isochorismatase n=1 Tax=Pseudomonas thivervalensis TaxID=86265 RepID=A0A2Z4ZR27_9PSED|nr:isochorismatase family cysteine hydrolase [Pseudomonas thivervalensis]AXA54356.1 isochorismatase [Pseudomonas thivervalensis]AXA60036.1 isochorismatase [Pseudomonas thivervalensis]
MTQDTALLVIDLQKEDGFPLERFDHVIENATALVDCARKNNIPLFYTRHVNDAQGLGLALGEPVDAEGKPTSYRAGTSAIEIIDALAPQTGDVVIDKQRYSAFHGTRLTPMLRERGIKHLVVMGVLTDVCVMSSLFDAYQHDFHLSLVADACTATTTAAHYSALFIVSNWLYGLDMLSTEQLLRRWAGEPAPSLRTMEPDHLAFQPEEFMQAIARLENCLVAKTERRA